MKILHTSDWHLGIQLHRHSLIEDQRYMLEQLYQIVEEEHISIVLLCGDVYDTTLATKDAIMLFDEAMKMLCQTLKCQVIVIAGNHDSHVRLSAMHDLLHDQGLHLYGLLEEAPRPLTIGDVDFYCVPFIHKDTLARIYDQSFTTYEEAFTCLMDDIRSRKNKRRQFVLAHAFVSGASVGESDRLAMVGGADHISCEVFHDMDYVALGHLHKKQACSKHIRYSGSPLAYAFSETKEKSVTIIDSDTMEIQVRPLKPLHSLVTLEGDYKDVMVMLPEHQNDYVKIILKDQGIQYELLEFIRERCPYLLTMQAWQKDEMIEYQSVLANELEQLTDEEILSRFFHDYHDRAITDEELVWFREAKEGMMSCE